MIHTASKVAAKSTFARARTGAVISKGGRILSTGFNRIGSNKNIKAEKHPQAITIHAEEAAIIPLLVGKRQHMLVNATLNVSRILKDGTTGLAKPCDNCMQLIRAVGIKRIFFTTDNNTTEEIRV